MQTLILTGDDVAELLGFDECIAAVASAFRAHARDSRCDPARRCDERVPLAVRDLRAAIAAGLMTRDDVRAELGAIVAGRAQGRRTEDEIILFDSTGAGFQDTAAASVVYQRAIDRGNTCAISFASSSPSTR